MPRRCLAQLTAPPALAERDPSSLRARSSVALVEIHHQPDDAVARLLARSALLARHALAVSLTCPSGYAPPLRPHA